MTYPSTHPALARALAARGYTVPTPVQLAVLEADASGRDLLVSAQTGSGKTVAFGLALGGTLLGEAETLGPAAEPRALVIAPTRELAMQVARELGWLYEATGARVVTCVGGMDARAEARQLQAGAHIVVGTPGRLRDHLERGRLLLGGLQAAVLDEADEMLDLGFREDLEFILDATPAARRTLLFSATLPREIETLATRYQRDALRIETVRRNEPHADIDYVAHRVAPHDIERALVNVLRLHEARAALVFCSTREAVNRLSARLVERGFSAVALSGELTQHERTKALQSLRDGRSRVLVATDVAARGLDLPDLALVVHADLPNDAETLLHRSGRTGRAGRKGLCVLIVGFNRRRKAETLIGAARIKVTWSPAPAPEAIRARDQERFVADPAFTTQASEDELQALGALKVLRSADEIALALLRMHQGRLPAAEELSVDTGPPPRRENRLRDERAHGERHRGLESGPRQGSEPSRAGERAPRPPRPRRNDDREMVWYRINIGRERKAEARWLLPLICRQGGVTSTEIGAIRIEERESRFQVVAEFAEQFERMVRNAKKGEGQIVRLGDNPSERVEAVPAVPAPTPQTPAPPASQSGPREHGAPHARSDHQIKRHKPGWRGRPADNAVADTASLPAPAEADGRSQSTDAAASPAPDRHPVSQSPLHGATKKRDKSRWRSRDKRNKDGWSTLRRPATHAAPRARPPESGHGEGTAKATGFRGKRKHHTAGPAGS